MSASNITPTNRSICLLLLKIETTWTLRQILTSSKVSEHLGKNVNQPLI